MHTRVLYRMLHHQAAMVGVVLFVPAGFAHLDHLVPAVEKRFATKPDVTAENISIVLYDGLLELLAFPAFVLNKHKFPRRLSMPAIDEEAGHCAQKGATKDLQLAVLDLATAVAHACAKETVPTFSWEEEPSSLVIEVWLDQDVDDYSKALLNSAWHLCRIDVENQWNTRCDLQIHATPNLRFTH